jgi:dienelactone hydrolase
MAPMGATKFTSTTPLPAGFTASLDDWLGVASAPKLPDGTDDPDAVLPVRAHDAIDAVGTAVFDAVNYLSVRADGYVNPEHANFARDGNGKIIPAPEKPTDKIWVTFFTPKTPMPASGYPIIIVQHGLSGSREYAFDLANTLCKKGWMVAAIDSVTFGARAPEANYQSDQHSDWASAPGAKYDGPDGLADPSNGSFNGSTDLFGTLLNIGALRDQFRQAELDMAQLAKVLRSSPDLSPLQTTATAPKIDPAAIAYVGDSLGGIEGAVAAGIEPKLDAWTLNVAGGGIVNELAVRSPVISFNLNGGGLNFGLTADQFTDSHLLVTMIETIAEPGDPLLYASHLVTAPHTLKGNPTKPRNVLQIEVLFDELVTNEADEALARAAGMGLAPPNVGSNAELVDLAHPDKNVRAVPLIAVTSDANGIHDTPVQGTTAVVVQAGPATHGADLVRSKDTRTYAAPWALFDTLAPFPHAAKPYDVSCPYRELQITMTGFFASAFAGQVPTVAGFKAPVRDLDDDGTPDATDPDSNDPTKK